MPADPLRAPHDWLDRDAGPVVRPYALTQGRVAPTGAKFDLVAFVAATVPPAVSPSFLQPEQQAIISIAGKPISVVEVASKLDLSVGVVRVLLGDLRSAGLVSIHEPSAASKPHDVDVLKAVVNGLRAL